MLCSFLFLQGHSTPITCVARNASDHIVVSASQNGSLLLHTVSTQQVVNLSKEEGTMQVNVAVY